MRFYLTVLAILLRVNGHAQTLSESQQKAVNSGIQFMNDGTAEISSSIDKLKDLYRSVGNYRETKRGFVQPYTCRFYL
jgi:hypothetical protein